MAYLLIATVTGCQHSLPHRPIAINGMDDSPERATENKRQKVKYQIIKAAFFSQQQRQKDTNLVLAETKNAHIKVHKRALIASYSKYSYPARSGYGLAIADFYYKNSISLRAYAPLHSHLLL